MSTTRKPWTAQDHKEATSDAEELGMKVYGLAAMLKVCAFAAEARSTLQEIEHALSHRDQVRQDLRNHVHSMTNWQEMRDTSCDALEYIAGEMNQAMHKSVDLVYWLADRLKKAEQSIAQASSGEAAS